MKLSEQIEQLKNKDLRLFIKTRNEVFNKLSDEQTMFCCCGRLASGLHEKSCKKFNNKVDKVTVKLLLNN